MIEKIKKKLTLFTKNKYKQIRSESKRQWFDFKLKLFIWMYGSYDIQSIFQDKRVAIVGPADSALQDENGAFIDEFDLIVRVNNSPRLLKNPDNFAFLGSRTDVLFHNLNETHGEKGGKLDFGLYKEQKLQFLISFIRMNDPSNMNVWILHYLKKYRRNIENKLRIVPPALFVEMVDGVNPKKPTTGLIALYTVLNTNFKELYITGFTFFQTNYIDIYRPGMSDPGTASKMKKSLYLHHNPDSELAFFKKALSMKHKNVKLDKVLESILNS